MAKIRLAVVDKREVIRQGIAKLLRDDLNLEVVCTANMVQEVLKENGRHRPDIILISCPLYECGGKLKANHLDGLPLYPLETHKSVCKAGLEFSSK